MDYCQLPAFLNNTVMNILTHKVFFISLFYECLVGKDNWGTCVIIFADIFQWLCSCWVLIEFTWHFLLRNFFLFWEKSSRKQERSTTSESARWVFLAALGNWVWFIANLILLRNPLSIVSASFGESSGVSCGSVTCAHDALITQKLHVIIFLAKYYSAWSPATGLSPLFTGIVSQWLLEK